MKYQKFILVFSLFVAANHGFASDFYPGATYGVELEAKRGEDYISGLVEFNTADKSLALSLQPVMPRCPDDMLCIQVMPQVETYDMKIFRIYEDHCGVIKILTHPIRGRAVDGMDVEVVVTDNSRNACPTFIALPETEVVARMSYYDRINGRSVKKEVYMEGNTLVPLADEGLPQQVFVGQILKAHYTPKTLKLKLRYGGGCKEHAFDLAWGECKSRKILNTTIKECQVEVIHTQGYDDYCKALITKDVDFDLSHLGASYILNINGTRVLAH